MIHAKAAPATRRSRPPVRPAWIGLISLAIAAPIWLVSLRFIFPVDTSPVLYRGQVSEVAREIARRQMTLWSDPDLRAGEVQRMRRSNSEWDFVGRTYLVWGLANLALRDPSLKDEALQVIDAIVAETVRLEEENGFEFFLRNRTGPMPFAVSPPASLLVDSEISLMMGLRRTVEEDESYRAPMADRVEKMLTAMRRGRALSAESYPNEARTVDNVNALAAVKIADVLDRTNRGRFLERWVDVARDRLLDEETGLLVSMYDLDGRVYDGPEGSTIWQVAHALQIVDADFARDQYEKARRELGVSLLGFGLARQSPGSWSGSRSSSGLALVAAGAFGDEQFLESLLRSVQFAAFPVRDASGLRYAASSQPGDAVLLYALTAGPVWEEIQRRAGQ